MSQTGQDLERIAGDWVAAFNRAVTQLDAAALAGLFAADSHWRNISGLGWSFATVSGRAAVVPALIEACQVCGGGNFALAVDRHPPRLNKIAGEEVVEAVLRFQTAIGSGVGVVRFKPGSGSGGDLPVAWSLMTAVDRLDHEADEVPADAEEAVHDRSTTGENWLDRRKSAQRYEDRDPDVIVVGGGHAGITSAVELRQLGLDALIVDTMKRVGDNWRLRYHSLKLHNVTQVNHLPYMPFPKTFPRYIPKDKIANWLESYVEHMDLNFWTETRFSGATYDDATGRWRVRLERGDGSVREMHPKHIIMATSVSGTPIIPEIPTLENFAGTVLHSSRFPGGEAWAGRKALVFGTGTSGHDIAQELHANGADVTIVQRSPTLIVNVDPSAQLYDGSYFGLDEGKRLEDLDLFNTSVPIALIKENHKLITAKVRELDKDILDRLEKAGFRLEFGEDGTGWPLKYRTRGGGYYFNAGCSELIADGKVGLIQYHDIERFTASGALMKDGSEKAADLIVLATGYKGPDHVVGEYFGAGVASRVGKVWGFDAQTQELANMWVRTGQPGLWFTGGSFSQCRIYSKYLAKQILGVELGLLEKAPAGKTPRVPDKADAA
jgi:cation diffusion facilitator CzcD-associated flavoprotein CzcO